MDLLIVCLGCKILVTACFFKFLHFMIVMSVLLQELHKTVFSLKESL